MQRMWLMCRPLWDSEDFSEFFQAGVPTFLLWVGAVEPAKFAAAKQSGTVLWFVRITSELPVIRAQSREHGMIGCEPGDFSG